MAVLERVPGERHVVLVHVDGHVELAAGALGEADVVEVSMGEHDRGDVARAPAEGAQGLVERLPRPRHAGVDDGEPAFVLDQVPVGVGVLDAVDAFGDVRVQHDGQPPRAARGRIRR
jgi:hypothetical protein